MSLNPVTSRVSNTADVPPESTPTYQTSTAPPTQKEQNRFAGAVVSLSIDSPFGASSGNPVISAGPDHTFGPSDKPGYDLKGTTPANDPQSGDGKEAANALLRMEQGSGGVSIGTADEARFVTEALAKHKNDPGFLQQYFGTLGATRTANIFSYLTSLGHVKTPHSDPFGNSADANTLKQQYQDLGDALSTLVRNKDFNQADMDRLVGQFAKGSIQNNFSFAKDVLSKTSPEVNQMFYQSAKNYALNHATDGDPTKSQAMAAYSLQALSQTSNPMAELAKMPKEQMATLVKAAMQGEARYGNPPTADEFAKTGVYSSEPGQGAPLNGLSSLMLGAAYSNESDRFSRAPLSTDQAHDLQARLFSTTVEAMQSDPSLQSFYQQNVPMKDALAADFQQGYDTIVKNYSGPDGEMNSAGMQAFQGFFSNALFTPPPSGSAVSVTQFFQGKLNSFVADANKLGPNGAPSNEQRAYAKSLGEQAESMSLALKQSLASILAGSTEATKGTQDLLNTLLTGGEAGVGAAGPLLPVGEAASGPVGVGVAFGSAIVGEALKMLVASGKDHSVEDAIKDLKSHGIDVTQYSAGNLQDQSEKIQNITLQNDFQMGLNNSKRTLD